MADRDERQRRAARGALLLGNLLLVAGAVSAEPVARLRREPALLRARRPADRPRHLRPPLRCGDRRRLRLRPLPRRARRVAGMNLTRIYPGGMFEVEDKYVPGQPARSAAGTADPALGAVAPCRAPTPRSPRPGEPSYKLRPRPLEPRVLRAAARVRRARRRGGGSWSRSRSSTACTPTAGRSWRSTTATTSRASGATRRRSAASSRRATRATRTSSATRGPTSRRSRRS